LRRAALLALLACLVLSPLARADGDPASDYLLSQPVFLPPDVVVPEADAKQLTETVAAAKARGYEIRVAVIGTRYDLGSVGALFKKPQEYALFLGQELRFVYKGRLLVVMPNGFGVSQGGKRLPKAEPVVARLAPPRGSGAELTTAADTAVRKLAASSGVELPPPGGGDSRSNGTKVIAIVGGVAVLFLVVAAAVFLVRRRGVRTA
jgi:hypothetical protein